MIFWLFWKLELVTKNQKLQSVTEKCVFFDLLFFVNKNIDQYFYH